MNPRVLYSRSAGALSLNTEMRASWQCMLKKDQVEHMLKQGMTYTLAALSLMYNNIANKSPFPG
jgi:hypothetical protein